MSTITPYEKNPFDGTRIPWLDIWLYKEAQIDSIAALKLTELNTKFQATTENKHLIKQLIKAFFHTCIFMKRIT
ncbi:hypothetical protein [Marinomonas mediterranea]|jgi:hypothetical protein|uniref:hypothetical protein n=1 Tax=Marinomonas mediterranea TaxID=119864 RepID=UPI00030FFC40|nr:hypothetical protein [Marinomonas mediterranea]WCN11235.1 hypothetical protein GV055_21015 [Marinomonas mediterranea]WCN19342.1 hypothetical protein GV053_20995 [Marinomonas mediterranea MMB-1]